MASFLILSDICCIEKLKVQKRATRFIINDPTLGYKERLMNLNLLPLMMYFEKLCDESLTAFLERSPGPLSYHIQLNICHDITLAQVYLHSNGVIHRDLTGNNILMIAGTQAKITDFGMSKLANVNPRMTMCPGNVLYMSPEALDEAKIYTAKLDIFSFGVIVIQILTRQFPNPADRFRLMYASEFDQEVRVLVFETERREAHLKLIPDTHSLKPLALQCLKKKENDRPSTLQLNGRLFELKQSSQYTESMHQIQSSSDIQQLQQQLRGQRILTEAKTREAQEHQTRNTELQSIVEEKDRQLNRLLQENQAVIQAKDRQLQECQHTIARREHVVEMKERELQQTEGQLQASVQLVSEFQQSLLQKDKTINDLQKTILAHEREIQQLEHQTTASRDQPQQQAVIIPQTKMATAKKGVSKMTWKNGKNTPQRMARGVAVVHGNTAYFRPGDSYNVYSYQNILGKEQWSQLPDNPNRNCGLAVIDGLLTSVGGDNNGPVNTLLSLTGESMRKQWHVIFPSMPTPRVVIACITTEQSLVVAGGKRDGDFLDIVEVMNINTQQWTTVSPLPQKQYALSATVCGGTLYLAGGSSIDFIPSKSVFTCSLPDLLTSFNSPGSTKGRTLSQSQHVWKQISSLPVEQSTLASFNGQLLAIGGKNESNNYSNNVYKYDSHTNSWNVITQMKNKRSCCLAVTLHEDHLILVGGFINTFTKTDSVEILE